MSTPTATSAMEHQADLELALRLADIADEISLPRFGAVDLHVETKPDLTPVSDADTAVESALREVLGRERPADAILGEEEGATTGHISGAEADNSAGRRWVIDPIDGTKSFVRGVPVWATLVALEAPGPDGLHTRVGVVSAPALSRRWWGTDGGGAWTSFQGGPPRPVEVSGVRALGDASISYASIGAWKAEGKLAAMMALLDEVWRTRGYGDFWSHMLVAEGAVDISAEPELSRWDMAALQVVVEQAGGRFTDLEGVRGSGGRGLLCSNGHLHDAVVDRLS